MKISPINAIVLVLALNCGNATAELHDRGRGLIYDSILNVTWISDLRYVQTSGFDLDGKLTWAGAVAWADDLEFAGYSDWRLPTLIENDSTCSGAFDSDSGRQGSGASSRFNCTGGELSHLFVVSLGNKAGESVHNQANDSDAQKSNYHLFRNIDAGLYWSSVQRADLTSAAWTFDSSNGSQVNNRNKSNAHFSLALRSGDVPSVPEPATYLLLAVGVVLLTVPARVRRHHIEKRDSPGSSMGTRAAKHAQPGPRKELPALGWP